MSQIHQISPEELQRLLKAQKAILVDVREPAEHQSESIAGARNLPLSQVTIDEAHLPEHRHKKLVIHCQSGKRAMLACEKLMHDDAPYDVWNLEGGISAWKTEKLSTQSTGKKILPLNQQVQLAIGLMIIIGMTLGYFASPWGYLLTLLAGFGLINAGLTGWCGLALLMAKMPWNQV